MHQHQSKHGVVDVGADLVWSIGRRDPIRSSYAVGDCLIQGGDGGFGVGLEKSLFNLAEDISDGLALFR